jgi:hypothetical protein
MLTAHDHTTVSNFIEQLEKIAPKSCSKPKSEMCTKCLDRVTSDRALQINAYILQLKQLQDEQRTVPSALENAVIALLNT